VKAWLESIEGGLKRSTYRRRVVCINQLIPFFKTIPMRSITSADIEKWKLRRGASIAARTFNKELETLNHREEFGFSNLQFGVADSDILT
jgi:hypothetical protein